MADAVDGSEPMIRLEQVTKQYPGAAAPTLLDLDLEVAAGETMVLVGPSGCGKTTTMRLINRLIEPSSGHIFVDGADVAGVDPDQLRQGIGYVIQQVGLFPHVDIATNIGMVPRAIGWSRPKIAARVDELLDLVGLDPAGYRRRYPRQLSGGQQQRVGVARALAADPPVLLMDEPFGAIDPITRERLQDEFLALQQRIRKTIVFVTHDITEAIKMGDRIAIFAEGRLAQVDTPARILASPADDFVASFIGSGAAMRSLGLRRVSEAELQPLNGATSGPTVSRAATLHDAADLMLQSGSDWVIVTDETGNPYGRLAWQDVLRHGDTSQQNQKAAGR